MQIMRTFTRVDQDTALMFHCVMIVTPLLTTIIMA